MADDPKDDGEAKPCLLDRWLSEQHKTQDFPPNPEDFEKIIGDTAESVGDKLGDLFYEVIKGSAGYELFQKLRGIHIAAAQQLGLVEEWMRTEIRRNMPHVMEDVVDIERDRLLDFGVVHVQRHIELGVKEDTDDDDDEEPPMVH